MMSQVFLSASIPIPGRKPFDRDIEVKRIRDSVLALVEVCRDRELTLTFGGHPAISPLVHHAADSLGVTERVTIFQSEFYRNLVPEAALKFPNLIWTPPGQDKDSSLAIMREAMLNPRERQYDVAVFIGGMEGIFDEARRFHATYPGKPMIPLQLTGGASRMVVDELGNEPGVHWRIPSDEQDATSMLRYRRLLNDLLASI
jgi:SLOG-like protein